MSYRGVRRRLRNYVLWPMLIILPLALHIPSSNLANAGQKGTSPVGVSPAQDMDSLYSLDLLNDQWGIQSPQPVFTTPALPVPYSTYVSSIQPTTCFDGAPTLDISCSNVYSQMAYERSYIDLGTPIYRLEGLVGVDLSLAVSQLDPNGGCYVDISTSTPFVNNMTWVTKGTPLSSLYTSPGAWSVGPVSVDLTSRPRYLVLRSAGNPQPNQGYVLSRPATFTETYQKFFQGSDYMVVQAGPDAEVFTLVSPVSAPQQLLQNDLITVCLTTSDLISVQLELLQGGTVQRAFTISPEGGFQNLTFTIDGPCVFDQIGFESSIKVGGYLEISSLRIQRPLPVFTPLGEITLAPASTGISIFQVAPLVFACTGSASIDTVVHIIDASDPSNPRVDSVTLPGRRDPSALAPLGDYLYVCSDQTNLNIIQISSLQVLPPFARSGFKCQDIAISGMFAFIAGRDSGLHALGLSAPDSPEYLDSCLTDGSWDLTHVAVGGQFAYCTAGTRGLVIVDASDPNTLWPDSSLLFGGAAATGLAVSGQYAFVIVGLTIRVVDVSRPLYPIEVLNLPVPSGGIPNQITIDGDYALVACGSAGVFILDISDPVSAHFTDRFVPAYSIVTAAGGILEGVNYLYLADTSVSLHVVRFVAPKVLYENFADGMDFDCREPQFRVFAQQFNPVSARITISGQNYALDRVGSTKEFVLRAGSSAWTAWQAAWGTLARGAVSISLRVSDAIGCYIWDVFSFNKVPGLTGSLALPNPILHFEVEGTTLFVSDGYVHAFDISVPDSPVELWSLNAYPADSFSVSGPTLGIQSGRTLSVFDISDLPNPVFYSQWVAPIYYSWDPTQIHYTALSDNGYAHMMGGIAGTAYSDFLIDISDPSNPTSPSVWTGAEGVGEWFEKGFAYGNFLYATLWVYSTGYTGWGMTAILDWTNPQSAVLQNWAPSWIDAAFQGNFVYAVSLQSGQKCLRVYELNMGIPSLLATYYPHGSPTLTDVVSVSGGRVCLGELDGIEVVDVTNPAVPVFAGKLPSGSITDIQCFRSMAFCAIGNQLATFDFATDISAPSITLDSPLSDSAYYGIPTPVLSVTLTDDHLSADGVTGILNVSRTQGYSFRFDRVGTTNQYRLAQGGRDWNAWASRWASLFALSYSFEIIAADEYGNTANQSIMLTKDLDGPNMQYYFAWPNGVQDGFVYALGSTPPQIEVSIYDPHLDLDSIYAVLTDSSGNYWGSFNLSIYADHLFGLCNDSSAVWAAWAAAWGNIPTELYTLVFHARDLAGNWDWEANPYAAGGSWFRFYKDFSPPTISVDLPLQGQVFASLPSYDILVGEYPTYLTFINYTCDNGLHVYNIAKDVAPYPSGGPHHYAGPISAESWNLAPEGSFNFTLIAYDSGYNAKVVSIGIVKETLPPRFANISPATGFASQAAPPFVVDIREENGLADVWYTVDGGTPHHLSVPNPVANIYTLSGTIDAADWGNHVAEGSPVQVRFFARDNFGRENSTLLRLYRDTTAPGVEIISPTSGACFSTPPSVTFSLAELNPDYCRYTIGSESRYVSPVQNGLNTFTIDLGIWTQVSGGPASIILTVHDKVGFFTTVSIAITKDLTPPVLALLTPSPEYLNASGSSITWEGPPLYSLSLFEDNPGVLWVSSNGGVNQTVLSALTGTLPASFWDAVPYGSVAITFGATDKAGNPTSLTIPVVKRDSTPLITINKPGAGLYSAIPPSYDIRVEAQGAGIGLMQYSFDGGSSWCSFFSLAGKFNATLWRTVSNGSVTVLFRVQSVYGQTGMASRTISVDNLGPIISIVAPVAGDDVGAVAPLWIITVEDAHLQVVYYSLDGGVSKIPIPLGTLVDGQYQLTGTIDQGAWDLAKLPQVHIQFYALDTLGNLAMQEVIVDRLDYKPRGDDLDFSLFFNMPWPVAVFCAGVVVAVFAVGIMIRRGGGRVAPT